MLINKIKLLLYLILLLILGIPTSVFAAKYTVARGIDFNGRVKSALNISNNSASIDKTLRGFKRSDSLPANEVKLIDISEDGDGSVLAYIQNNILYYLAEEEVYLNEDCSYMFDKFINLQNANFNDFNFSKMRKANFMFGNCKFLTNIDFDNDTPITLTEMEGMFYDCESLVDLNIYMIDTHVVKEMRNVFYNCYNLKNINIDMGKWSMQNVISVSGMFKNCHMLKTNFNRKADNIEETQYFVLARPGNEYLEGLLKDYNYEYDDYGKLDGTYSVKDINDVLEFSSNNINIEKKLDNIAIDKAKALSNVALSTQSEFYSHGVEISIGKNGKVKFSDAVAKKAIESISFDKSETTEVETFVIKTQEWQRIPKNVEDIIDEEEATKSNIKKVATISDGKIEGGILRPTYSKLEDFVKKETIESVDENIEKTIENINESTTESIQKTIVNIEDESPVSKSFKLTIIIIIGAIAIILLGIVVTIIKSKNENNFDM